MSDEDKHSKTEKPTQKRLDEARKKDAPPQSRDLTSMVTLLAAVLMLSITGRHMFDTIKESSRELLAGMGTYQVTSVGVYSLMLKQMGTLAVVLGPFMVVVITAGVAANVAQGGINLSWEKLTANFDKLNPVNGIGRLFKKDSLVELLKAIFKIGIIGYMSYRIIRGQEEALTYLGDKETTEIFAYLGWLSFKIIVNSIAVLVVLAFLDLAYVKWRFIENLKMTKEEVKQESKDSEGDPKIKGKIRMLQFELSRRRLIKIIPTADVIITNPTHFAVALKYDRERMAAPVVIAKGVDNLALKIREIAKEHRVMIVENRPLARELYATVKEGQEIPESLYKAVAEVLAYVFGLRGRL